MHRSADDTLSLPLAQARLTLRASQDQSNKSPPVEPLPKKSYWHLLALILITAIGGAFRFCRLTYPPLWNDETLIYWRVCGSYAQMLEPLRQDMFPPLHYSLYWLIGHYHKLTPLVIRLVPAIAGTLTIPAIYFLSRQLLYKGTSLLAAAFTACSAFMLFYSRDAKMYPELWLLVTLNVACLLWWFRTGKSTPWLCWIATGCAMTGLHASALVIPALCVLFLLTQHRLHWQKVLWFLLGTALIFSGPIGYFTKFNPAVDRLNTEGWETTHIGWVGDFYNGDRTGPELARYTASAFLIGYEWPREDYIPDDLARADQPISPPLVEGPITAASEVFWILAIAALPWPLFLRPKRDPSAQPQWRVFLWLGGWVLLIAYAFYIPSQEGFASPRRWIFDLQEWLSVGGIALLIAITATFILVTLTHREYRHALIRFTQMMLATGALYALCMTIFVVMFPIVMNRAFIDQPIGSVWEPRYLGIIWPAVAIAVAALLMRLPTRPFRIAAIIFVLAINLVMAGLRLILTTEPPIDLLAKDIWMSQDPKSTVRTVDFIQYGDISVAGSSMESPWDWETAHIGSGRYYLQMLSDHQPMNPDLFASSLSLYNRGVYPKYSLMQKDIESAPQVQHVIIWSQLFPHGVTGKPQQLAYDKAGNYLPGWKLADEQVFTVRIYWDWRERWKWVRRDYVRRNAER